MMKPMMRTRHCCEKGIFLDRLPVSVLLRRAELVGDNESLLIQGHGELQFSQPSSSCFLHSDELFISLFLLCASTQGGCRLIIV